MDASAEWSKVVNLDPFGFGDGFFTKAPRGGTSVLG